MDSVQAGIEVMHETRAAMEQDGLDLSYLLGRVKYLCEATKPIAATVTQKAGKGKSARDADESTTDFIEVPDNTAIAAGVKIAVSLGGYEPPREIKADVKHSGSLDVLLKEIDGTSLGLPAKRKLKK
jgi:hypothetical protein